MLAAFISHHLYYFSFSISLLESKLPFMLAAFIFTSLILFFIFYLTFSK